MPFPWTAPGSRVHSGPERRAFERFELDPPLIGVARLGKGDDGEDRFMFVAVRNMSKSGILLESLSPIPPGPILELHFSMNPSEGWERYEFSPVWSRVQCSVTQTGLAFEGTGEAEWVPPVGPDALSFLLSSQMLSSVSAPAVLHLLGHMSVVRLTAGEVLISQGEPGDAIYFLNQGTCDVTIERDGNVHRVNVLEPSTIIGEMAVITGEPRSATVTARTDAGLWKLEKHRFEEAAVRFPELRSFMTEIVAHRFENSLTADRRIGKYVVGRKLGSGGWSVVYSAVHETLGMPVAVKMLRHDMAMMEGFRRKFRDEAKVIARLNHPNIVTVLDIEEVYQTIFIFMELLEGRTVKELLEIGGPLAPERAVNIMVQACEGLRYAHGQGILHQDIKPENIAVLPGDRVKIMDFGLACPPGEHPCGLKGTIFYMPPEQFRGESIDYRSDIFSLGITAFEMLTGRKPSSCINPMATPEEREEEDPPDPGRFRADLPDRLRQVVRKACSHSPGERHQSADELLHDLRELQKMHELSVPSVPDRVDAANLLLLYPEKMEREVLRLVEEFGRKAAESGIDARFSLLKDRKG
jgi:eukaryotic-like serine/threonine-protein kinase